MLPCIFICNNSSNIHRCWSNTKIKPIVAIPALCLRSETPYNHHSFPFEGTTTWNVYISTDLQRYYRGSVYCSGFIIEFLETLISQHTLTVPQHFISKFHLSENISLYPRDPVYFFILSNSLAIHSWIKWEISLILLNVGLTFSLRTMLPIVILFLFEKHLLQFSHIDWLNCTVQ